MKKVIFVFALLFGMAFILGCIGEKKEEKKVGDYTLTVTPKNVIAGGVVTVDLRIKNSFEKELKDLSASIKGTPTSYDVSGDTSGQTIPPNQEFPIIWTITTPDTDLRQTINPTIEICFDYETSFYFDVSIRNKTLVGEEVALQRGYSSGPISVAQIGLDNIFIDKEKGIGTLDIKNNWVGKIKEIKNISFSYKGIINEINISYSKCSGNYLSSSEENCDILKNEIAIGEGIAAKVEIGIDKEMASPTEVNIERIDGIVKYSYCYDIDVGTIVVCPAGQRC